MQTHQSYAIPSEHVKIIRLSAGRHPERDRLPSPSIQRWVTRRKAQVVAAVRDGVLSIEDACERYSLSQEEFDSWIDLLDHHGVLGLRATRSQEYRHEDDYSAHEHHVITE